MSPESRSLANEAMSAIMADSALAGAADAAPAATCDAADLMVPAAAAAPSDRQQGVPFTVRVASSPFVFDQNWTRITIRAPTSQPLGKS